MSEETSRLNNEITRLNKIINVLLEHNDTIKANYSHLLEQLQQNKSTERNTLQQIEQNNAHERNLLQQMGETNANLPETRQQTGWTDTNLPDTRQQMGVSNTNLPGTQQQMGVTETNLPGTQQHMGASNTNLPETSQQLPSGNIIPSETLQQPPPEQAVLLLPEKLIPSPELFSSIATQLEQAGFTRVKRNTRQTAAQLLVHFYNGGSANYVNLQQLTGYSQGGLGKLLIALRKRGFIQRAGYGNYSVTDKAKTILAQVPDTGRG